MQRMNIENLTIRTAGSFENLILYRMCSDYPKHKDPQIVSGKITAIGRIYAASPERGAGSAKINYNGESGYHSVVAAVAQHICDSRFDEKLDQLSVDELLCSTENLNVVTAIHADLDSSIQAAIESWSSRSVDPSWKANKQPSFCSKYLHFHRPNAFPILDKYARAGLTSAGHKGVYRSYTSFCEAFIKHTRNAENSATMRSLDTNLVMLGRQRFAKTKDVKDGVRS